MTFTLKWWQDQHLTEMVGDKNKLINKKKNETTAQKAATQKHTRSLKEDLSSKRINIQA